MASGPLRDGYASRRGCGLMTRGQTLVHELKVRELLDVNCAQEATLSVVKGQGVMLGCGRELLNMIGKLCG
jgi:hypothetical protein